MYNVNRNAKALTSADNGSEMRHYFATIQERSIYTILKGINPADGWCIW